MTRFLIAAAIAMFSVTAYAGTAPEIDGGGAALAIALAAGLVALVKEKRAKK